MKLQNRQSLIGFLSVFSIDPYEGDPKKPLTWGATLNHSRENANVKPYVADRNSANPRVFLVATHEIAETTELLWNYQDHTSEFFSNSQTLL